MKRAIALGGSAAFLCALACGVITLPESPIAPVNACDDNQTCVGEFPDATAQAQCNVGTCIAHMAVDGGSLFRPILVVAVPENASAAGGVTFGIPSDRPSFQLSTGAFTACESAVSAGLACMVLPPLVQASYGALQVTTPMGVALWPPGGLRPNQSDLKNTTLPVAVAFHPMWTDPATGVPRLAAQLGLPLTDEVAIVSFVNAWPFGTLFAPTLADAGSGGYVFGANLPQPITTNDPSATYRMEIVPVDPFEVFPPFLTLNETTATVVIDGGPSTTNIDTDLTLAPGTANAFLNSYAACSSASDCDIYGVLGGANTPMYPQNYTIIEAVGAPSLEGWKLYILNRNGRRVSGVVTLPAGATKSVTVFEATGLGAVQPGETLYIDPPLGVTSSCDASGVCIPFLRFNASALGVGNVVIPATLPYPALPQMVTVSGPVVRADDPSVAVDATVTFFANGNPSGPFVAQTDGTPAVQLLTSTSWPTIPSAGNQLAYNATLPQGTLRTYIYPTAPDLAITIFDNQVIAFPGGPGRGFQVQPRAHVKGRVVLPNGAPVFAADVVIDSSADAPLSNADDPLARPREARGTTDVNGFFDVPSDPGLVDVSIRPRDGTRFPWVVLTNRIVPPFASVDGGAGASAITLSDVVIPLPVAYQNSAAASVLIDSDGNLLRHAVVQAFAFPPVIPVDSGSPASRGARLVGSTVTDESAVFQLYVAPPDPQ